MRSKKTNYPAPIKRLEKDVRKLDKDIRVLIEEHDSLRLGGDDRTINAWYYSMPIETLHESLSFDHKKPREKFSLKDLLHKFKLKKLYVQKQKDMDKKASELTKAKIEYLLDKVKKMGIDTVNEKVSSDLC